MAVHRRFNFKPITAALVAALTVPVVPLAPSASGDQALPEVKLQGQAERADGPVEGYRATHSGTFTKTNTPFKATDFFVNGSLLGS